MIAGVDVDSVGLGDVQRRLGLGVCVGAGVGVLVLEMVPVILVESVLFPFEENDVFGVRLSHPL